MKGIKIALSILILLVIFSGCKQELTEKEYIDWVRDSANGLHVQREMNDIVIDVQYQPTQFIVLQRKKGQTVDALEIEKLKGIQYYLLTLSIKGGELDFIKHGISDLGEMQRKEYYYSYNFQETLRLEDPNGNVLPCILYHFEKPINLAKSRTFVLGFPSSESTETTFVIESENINSLPIKIKINKKDYPSPIAL